MTPRLFYFQFLLLFFALVLVACDTVGEIPPNDDDTSDDDDSAAQGDDDDIANDDDVSDDDDAADDDDALGGDDFLDAVVPTFDDCSGNQFKLGLGDGSEVGPFEGFFPAPTSFANGGFTQFTIRTGEKESWSALNGNYEGLSANTDIQFTTPASVAGNVVLNASLSELTLGDASLELAGNYGMPANNPHSSVGGSVFFTQVPAPNAQTAGNYSAIIQKIVSLSSQQILLGVRGCFDATLTPTDGG
jgi:hypothetical protein